MREDVARKQEQEQEEREQFLCRCKFVPNYWRGKKYRRERAKRMRRMASKMYYEAMTTEGD